MQTPPPLPVDGDGLGCPGGVVGDGCAGPGLACDAPGAGVGREDAVTGWSATGTTVGAALPELCGPAAG
jgi:hypothetical protein